VENRRKKYVKWKENFYLNQEVDELLKKTYQIMTMENANKICVKNWIWMEIITKKKELEYMNNKITFSYNE
jgi:competence transcription factor ComK